MKSFLTFFVAATCIWLGNQTLSAQDLAPPRLSTPPPEVSPSPTAAPKPPQPAATPAQPKSTPAVIEEKKPERTTTERSLSSPRRDVLREKPVRAVEERGPLIQRLPAAPKSSRRASQPTFDLSGSTWVTAATIRSLENRWEAAVKDHDVDALDKLLAPSFEGTSISDSSASKSRMLALLRRDKNVYKSAKAHSMTVKNSDPKTAIVTGTSIEIGVTEDGKKFKISREFRDTWKQRKDRWECVESRVTKSEHR
ncbi:MAG: nuclear transport factor 2 family protein [Chthoniobacterales bacterium]